MREKLKKRVRDAVMACAGRMKAKRLYLEFERASDAPTARMKESDIKKVLDAMMSTSKGRIKLFMLAYLGLQVCDNEIQKLERGSDNLLMGD